MAAEEIHPGSWLGDSVEEFKKLPTWGKIALGVGLAVVIFLFIRARQQASANAAVAGASTAGAGTGTMSDMSAGTSSSGSNSPFPMVNGLPVLPTGTNPIYDPNGNLIGYQNQPTPTPTNNPPTQGGGNPPTNPIPQGTNGPLIPFGSYNGPSYSNLKWGTTYNYNGTTYQLGTGSNGNLWGVPVYGGTIYSQSQFNAIPIAPGQKQLLYGPQSAYGQKPATGSGPGPGTATGNAPYQSSYTAPAAPRLSTYTVLQGDTPNGIAARLGYPGGGAALLANNGGSIQPGQVLKVS